jgi:DNA modification methylase
MPETPIGAIADPLQSLKVSIDTLTLDPANARKHGTKNLDAIKASLHAFGQRKPIVVQRKGMIVRAGNGTLEAAKALGWSHLAAVIIDEDNATASQFAIADNRTAELAEWDDETLASLLDVMEPADREALAFDEDDMRELIDGLDPSQPEVVEDEVPEVPDDPVTKTGDLIMLGDHRLLCGDSTNADDVARLMDGQKAAVLIADPPYGMNLDADYSGMKGIHQGKKHEAVHGDDKPFNAASVVGCDGLDQFWFGADYYATSLGDTEHQGAWLVWDKRGDNSADRMFGSCFELVWCSKRRKRDVLRYKWAGIFNDGEARTFEHPTTKSVRLICDLITRASQGDVFDPFLGSGTTLIAAEQLDRKCYGMEISPAYCDVIVERWENLTGKQAVRGK